MNTDELFYINGGSCDPSPSRPPISITKTGDHTYTIEAGPFQVDVSTHIKVGGVTISKDGVEVQFSPVYD